MVHKACIIYQSSSCVQNSYCSSTVYDMVKFLIKHLLFFVDSNSSSYILILRGQFLKYRYTFIVDSLEGDLIGSLEEGNTDLYVTNPENVSMTTQKGNHGS